MYVHIANTYKSKIKSLLDDILEEAVSYTHLTLPTTSRV